MSYLPVMLNVDLLSHASPVDSTELTTSVDGVGSR